MKTLAVLFLMSMSVAHATTRIAEPNHRSRQASCELRAKFIGAKGQKIIGGRGQEARGENAVYWDLEVIDGSPTACPKGRSISVRVRAASFEGNPSQPAITYPSDIREPLQNQPFRMRIKFLQGKDTFLNREFAEWTFIERLDD